MTWRGPESPDSPRSRWSRITRGLSNGNGVRTPQLVFSTSGCGLSEIYILYLSKRFKVFKPIVSLSGQLRELCIRQPWQVLGRE